LGARIHEHDVAGLEITMRDALAVRLIESVGDLNGVSKRFVERQRSFCKPRSESLTLQKLHHEVVRTVLITDVVKHADIRMIECGDRLRLTLEPALQVRVF